MTYQTLRNESDQLRSDLSMSDASRERHQQHAQALQARIDAAIYFCRRHEHSGCSLAIHEFAASVRKVLEGQA